MSNTIITKNRVRTVGAVWMHPYTCRSSGSMKEKQQSQLAGINTFLGQSRSKPWSHKGLRSAHKSSGMADFIPSLKYKTQVRSQDRPSPCQKPFKCICQQTYYHVLWCSELSAQQNPVPEGIFTRSQRQVTKNMYTQTCSPDCIDENILCIFTGKFLGLWELKKVGNNCPSNPMATQKRYVKQVTWK